MNARSSLTEFQKNQAEKYSNINVPSSCSNHCLEKYSYVIKGMSLISKLMNEVSIKYQITHGDFYLKMDGKKFVKIY